MSNRLAEFVHYRRPLYRMTACSVKSTKIVATEDWSKVNCLKCLKRKP